MAILKIARMGHPLLARPAAPVTDPRAPALRAIIADMLETMDDANGTGLAAPQVHVPLRVVVFFVSGRRAAKEDGEEPPDEPEDVPLTVLINPTLEVLDDSQSLGWEACLSVPGLAGQVARYRVVRYTGLGPDGAAITREAEGYHARVVQHEFDHLDGILYPQRMTDLSRLVFTSEMHHMREARED